jgi:hypothetical protein
MPGSRAHTIPTSHVGTLPRPEALEALCTRFELPDDEAAFAAAIPGLVTEVVRRQAAMGISIVNDGEFWKKGGFSYYAQTRLGGIEERGIDQAPPARDITGRDAAEFPGYFRMVRERRPRRRPGAAGCGRSISPCSVSDRSPTPATPTSARRSTRSSPPAAASTSSRSSRPWRRHHRALALERALPHGRGVPLRHCRRNA